MNDRLRSYEVRSSTPLLVSAVIFIAVYAAPIIWPELPRVVRHTFSACSALIWAIFAIDLIVRIALADQRWHYLVSHPPRRPHGRTSCPSAA